MLENNGFDTVKKGYIVYFYPKQINNKSCKIDTEIKQIKISKKYINKTIEEIKDVLKSPIPAQNKNCKICKITKTTAMI